MLIRRDLGRLAGWRGPASEEAVGLACAIEVVLETMLGNSFSAGATFSWHLTSSSCGVHEPVVFRATWEGGSWKACPDDIEAALSLWLYSVHHREKRKEEEAAHGTGRRFAGTTKSRNKRAQENRGLIMMGSFDARVLRRDLSLWLPGESYQHIRLVFKLEATEGDSEGDPEYDETTDTHRIVGFAQNASNHPPMDIDACTYGNGGMVYKESTLAVYPTIDLKKLYAHHMFTAFMWAVAAKASERYPSFKGVDLFGSEVEIRSFIGPEPEYWRVQPTDQLSNERLSTLASKIEATGVLGPEDNIYYAILPPLSAWDLLPPVHAILKRGLEIAHKWEQRGDWRKVSITCVELFEKTSLFPRDNSTDVASEATALVMELLRVLTETINFRKGQVVNDDSKIHQLVDSAKWASARVAADNDAAIFPRLMGLYERQGRLWKCDLVGDISTYPTTMPGEFGFEKLHQAACDDDVPEKQRHDHLTKGTVNNQDFLGWAPIHYSVAHGSHGVLGYVLRRGANVNIQDVRRRTPLHYAYRHDDDKMVGRLLRAGADVNASDAGGMTPLHYAAKHGAAKVAAALIEGGANINVVDHGGRTPLAWAAWGGHAELAKKHLWDPTSKTQSDSYGRTPLHMAVTLEEGLGKDFGDMFGFLVPTIDMEVKDKRGYTPLHVAAIKGHLSAVQWLLAKGANVHAKETGWYYSRRRTWGFDLVNPGLTPLYLAKLMLKRARKKREIPLDILDEEYDESRFRGMAGGWESDYSAWYEGDSDIDETGRMVRGYKRRYHLQPGPDAIKGLEDVIRFLMQFDEVCEEERNEMDLQVGSDDNSDEKKSDEEKGDEDKSDDEKSDEKKNGEEGYVADGDGEE
jgi:ankyrin repeat protein